MVANREAVSSGNNGKFFAGAVRIGSIIEKSLAVGQSLNYNMNGVEAPFQAQPRVAFATYNSSIDMSNNVIVNFPVTPGKTIGAFAADDYYSKPIDKGHYRNRNNILINSHPGVRVPTPLPSFVFGLIMDPDDHWGGAPNVDNYYSYDRPFFTHGQTPLIVAPGTAASGGVVLTGPFYGVEQFYIDRTNADHVALRVKRLDNNFNIIDTYVVERGERGGLLQNMRHFATHPTGIYDLEFQENTMDVGTNTPQNIEVIKDVRIGISNMLTTNDYQVMAMEFSGTHTIDALYSSIAWNMERFGTNPLDPMPTVNDAQTHIYQPVASRAAVIASPLGEVYWHDKINNKVWFKIRGGLRPDDTTQPANADVNLYKWFNIRAYGTFTPLDANSFEKDVTIIKIYPNPTTGAVNIEFNSKNNEVMRFITRDAIGRELSSTNVDAVTGSNSQILDLSNYPAGIYLVTITNGNDFNTTKRIIKK